MQKLLKGSLTQKIILVLTIAIVCNFTIPNCSQAMDGGVLLDPIKMFISFIGDAAISGVNMCFTGQWIGASDAKATPASGVDVNEWKKHWAEGWGDVIDWPTILVTPEEIFSGKVLGLNVNFLREIDNNYEDVGNSNGSNIDDVRENLDISTDNPIGTQGYKDALTSLRTQIAKWYTLIRNLCAAALFCVLIYIGIRMMISSISEERAKYKSMMVNWVVAICLVFFLHYIMAIIMFVTEKTVDIIGSGLNNTSYTIKRPGTDITENLVLKTPARIGGNIEAQDYDESSRPTAKVYNLMELTRVYVSLENRGLAFAYLLVYLVLIVYTIMFIFKYLKRFMYMAFLTLIAPVIAFTYPIDKIKDGNAQAFNKWFAEYLFNALLQPLHLLIYVVLIGTAVDLVQVNFIYAIVAMAFISQSEKLLKSFFGMDKASTASGAGAFAKGALASQALSRIKSAGSTAKSLGSKGSGKSGGSSSKPRQAKGMEAYLGSNNTGKSDTTSGKGESVKLGKDNGSSAQYTVGPDGNPSAKVMGEGERSERYGSSDRSELPNEGKSSNQKLNTANTSANNRNPNSAKTNGSKAKQKKQIKHPKARAVGRVAGKVMRYTGKGIVKAAKAGGKAYVKAGAVVGGALIGGALTAATGNETYLAAGLAGGKYVGNKAVNAASSVSKAGKHGILRAKLGKQGVAARERYDEFKKDKDNINYFKEEYGLSTNKAKAMIEQGREFIEAGYTNPEDVNRLIKMQEASVDATSDQIMAADQMASQLKIDDFLDSKKSAQLEQNLTNQMKSTARASGKEITDERARELAHNHMNSMRVAKGLSTVDAKTPAKVTKAENPNDTKEKRTKTTSSRASSSRTSNRKPTSRNTKRKK